jgi:hypothetical protein
MNYKSNNIERDTKLIERYLDISKPNGVSNIEFKLRPTGDKGEYYMDITYVVPDGSEYLKINPFAVGEGSRYNWNHHISKDIKNYFGLKVIINNSGTRSEKFNYGK